MNVRLKGNEEKISIIRLKFTLSVIVKVYIIIFVMYSILGVIDHFSNSIDFSIVKSISQGDKFNGTYFILWLGLKTLIIAPVVEEFIFRKPIKFSKSGSVILLVVVLYSILMIIIKPHLNFYFLGSYAILMLGFFYFFRKKKNMNYIPLIFTSLVFGVFHINNIEPVEPHQWYLYIYNVFPIIILGIGLGLIRLRLNILWSIVGHSFFNLIPFFFKYIL